MKLLKYISLSFLLMAVVSGCETNLDKANVTSDPTAPTLNAISEAVVVAEETLEKEVAVSWDRADFGYSDAANYSLYAYVDGEDPVFVSSRYGSGTLVKYKDFNTAAIKLGLPLNAPGAIKLYLEAALSGKTEPLKSNVISLNITTYAFKDYLYVPGAHQGWSPGDASAKRLSTMSPADPYAGFVNFIATAPIDPLPTDPLFDPLAPLEFKFTLEPNWDNGIGGSSLIGTPPNLTGSLSSAAPGNISINPGFYYLSATIDSSGDPKTGTVTALLVNQLGIIGGAIGGWGDADDVVLIKDATNPYIWRVTDQAFAADEFKIRTNGNWDDASMGGSLEDLRIGGGNIKVEVAGTYDFEVDFTDTPFTITMTKK